MGREVVRIGLKIKVEWWFRRLKSVRSVHRLTDLRGAARISMLGHCKAVVFVAVYFSFLLNEQAQ